MANSNTAAEIDSRRCMLRDDCRLLLVQCSTPQIASLCTTIRRGLQHFLRSTPASTRPVRASLNDLLLELDASPDFTIEFHQRCCNAFHDLLSSYSVLVVAYEVEPLLNAVNNWDQLDQQARFEALREIGNVCFRTDRLQISGHPVDNGFRILQPFQQTITFERVAALSGEAWYRILPS